MPFLLKYWKYIALALAIVVIAVYHYSLTQTIADQKVKIVDQENQIIQLSETIIKQNVAVEQMKKDADEREAAGKKAIEQARAQALTYKQRADTLRMSQPKFPADLCLSADDLINQELRK